MSLTLDRRDFVKAAGVAAAGTFGIAGIAHADEATSQMSAEWMPTTWDAEADVIVMGYGCAGPVVAVELAKKGITSLLIEKMDRENAGGDCSVSGGYFLPNSNTTDPVTTNDYIVRTFNGVDEEFAGVITSYLNDAIDYAKSLGIDIDTESFPGQAIANAPEGTPRGQALYASLTSLVESYPEQITVMYETPGIDLVQNPVTGEVYGVKAGTKDAPLYLKGRLGVVLTSGSYESDRKMVNAIFMPGLLYPTIGSPANTGDGIKMLMKAGCKVQNFGKCLEFATWTIKQASEEVGVGLNMPKIFKTDSYIFVNRNGQRFMDETANIQHSKNDGSFQYNFFEGDLNSDIAEKNYPNVPSFIIFDEALRTAGALAKTSEVGYGWNVRGIYEWSDDNQAEIDKGWIVKADTLEELAEKISVPDIWGNPVSINPTGLVEQVESYNAMCEAGEDTQCGRSESSLAPIGDGPYYAAEIIPATLYSTGGATHDVNAQAVDWNDQPIPRLFMAGLVGDPYIVHTPGLVGAVAWGRVAAEQVAKLEPWD